jgi:pyruvate dehydrogenase E1 component alpha subunit
LRQDLVVDDAVIAPEALRIMPVNGHKPPAFAHQLERAVGSALAQKTKKNGKVTVVFGGAEHDDAWSDVLEVGRAHRLPLIFVAKAAAEELPVGRGLRQMNGAGLEPGTEMARIIVDGHDVVGSYRVAHEAIDRARKGRGATLIECAEFRVPGQRRRDAVAAMERYLRGKGLLERRTKQEMQVVRERKP